MKTTPHKVRVGVLRGGPSSEYEVSLKSGATALKHIGARHHVHDILIDRDGVWHLDGIAREPHKILRHVDVVFNAMHGTYGEDGKVQKILDIHGAHYNGAGHFASALAMNKVATKRYLEQHLKASMERGIPHAHFNGYDLKHTFKTPLSREIRRELVDEMIAEHGGDTDSAMIALARSLFTTFPQPSVIKPGNAGSSVGVSLVHTIPEIATGLIKAFEYSDVALVEEYIKGTEATVGIVEQFRGEPLYALMPVEIVHDQSRPFFDYQAKYGGGSNKICPGRFTPAETAALQDLAKAAHHALGLKHYSRMDFMVSPRRGIYFLEANTLPGITDESLFPQALAAGGTSLPDFFDHVIALSMGH